MPPGETSAFATLRDWYHGRVRRFLEQHAAERVADLNRDLSRAQELFERCQAPIAVCFLGSSGVGKSTLINALVDDRAAVVPSGGIGPLTAQALAVRYAESRSFEATYHTRQPINQLQFSLRQMYRQELEAADPTADESDGSGEAGPLEDDTRRSSFRKQAQLLVTGRQDDDSLTVRQLDESLARVLGQEARPGVILPETNAGRLEFLARLFERESRTARFTGDRQDFFGWLRHHASGFLAPVIQSLEVHWPSELLKTGIVLVDLPGLGVAGDIYREVTNKWVTREARAVVLVVDRAGLTESNAQLLRTSGFLNRLLHSAHEPEADPVALHVAVVKLDDVAESAWRQDKQERPDRLRKRVEYFEEACRQVDTLVRGQVREAVEQAWAPEAGVPSEAKQRVVEKLVAGIRVFPVSAVQFAKCMADDEEDVPFIKEAEKTGIPAMRGGLRDFAAGESERRRRQFLEARDLFCDQILSALRVLKAQWEGAPRAAADVERLQADLRAFLQPLREEFRVRQGQFRGYLKETLPAKIENVIEKAKQRSVEQMRAQLDHLRGVIHHSTLKAVVERGGTFRGKRHVELPRDFALTFEEPVAELWGGEVLPSVQRHTKDFADDCAALVGRVADWCRSQENLASSAALIEAVREGTAADARRSETVGRDIVGRIRERVKDDLTKAIEPAIRRRCSEFVSTNEHRGAGSKNRTLDFLDELPRTVIAAASGPTATILNQCYELVVNEVNDLLLANQDPLSRAERAIVGSDELSELKRDAQRQLSLLAEIDALRASCPTRRSDGVSGPVLS